MRVAEGRVGDEQALLLQRPFGEFFRAEFQQQLARAGRRSCFVIVGVGTTGSRGSVLSLKPFACGLPLTMTSPRKLSSLVARSRRGLN